MITNNVKLAYLAGIVDGEGTISLRCRKRHGSLDLRLQVAGTDNSLMEWLTENFGGSVHISRRISRFNPLHKPCSLWHVNGGQAYEVITQLKPLLIIKREQATLALEAWDKREPTPRENRRQPVSERIKAIRMKYVDQMHLLNAKGLPA